MPAAIRPTGRQPQRAPAGAPLQYERHRPEQTTLCRLVQQYAASVIAHAEANSGSELPRFIKDGFDAFHVRARWRHRLYDSLVIAAALAAGCRTLLSEDFHPGQRPEGLTIVDALRRRRPSSPGGAQSE
jgi:hypothetical protein